ncbi:multiple sugar transport system permease protein [Deinococcus metalli]|uniref:ABC transporter permease n=1 Tax=Deinococcus metalli TaxID=1141878 RepID=A0A7W8KE65_9DEIO|nr:carbohydrate ABC transporter permease [Deinococcus metalli]MBB5376527.1 multiple sugar transport system permease protein [Deinococcus metalli]GHF43357.1 ABC transporter permease [Deinococcus metalli]
MRNLKWTPWVIVRETLFYAMLVFVAAVMALPFYWMVVTSLKPDADIFSDPIRWWPQRVTFEHYVQAFTVVPFARYFWNSTVMALLGVVANLILGSLAGYAFARMRFRGREGLFRMKLASLLIPGVVTLIPTFIILRSFPLIGGNDVLGHGGHGLLNTYWAIVLPGAAGAFAVFFMRQFFRTLPDDLMDAARVDGASEWRTFWNIYLPLCGPALATLGIFTFQAGWNVFLWALIVFNDPKMSTVQMGLQSFSFNHQTDYGPLMAASVVVSLPVLIVFLFAQRYFTQSISFTGVKG